MKKGIKIAAAVLCIGALTALVAARIMKPAEEIETKEKPYVTLTSLKTGSISNETSLMGTIQPSDTYYVMPKAAGEILEIYTTNGQAVKKGDPIARIDNQKQIDAAKIQLDQASVQAGAAADSLNRLQALYAAGDVSAQDYEGAKAQSDAAAAGVEAARLNYDTQVEFATVTAPAEGVVQNQNMTVNAMVSQSSQLCIITGSGAKTVNFNVTEDLLHNLSMGQTVTVEKSGSSYTGVISDIGQVVNAQTGLFPVKATLEQAEGLSDGASCKLHLTAEQAEQASLIPVDCIYYSAGEPYVYTYQDGTVHKNIVKLGITGEQEAQVLEGLTADQQVVSSWTDELYDGAAVQISEGTQSAAESATATEITAAETSGETEQAAGTAETTVQTAGTEQTEQVSETQQAG